MEFTFDPVEFLGFILIVSTLAILVWEAVTDSE